MLKLALLQRNSKLLARFNIKGGVGHSDINQRNHLELGFMPFQTSGEQWFTHWKNANFSDKKISYVSNRIPQFFLKHFHCFFHMKTIFCLFLPKFHLLASVYVLKSGNCIYKRRYKGNCCALSLIHLIIKQEDDRKHHWEYLLGWRNGPIC